MNRVATLSPPPVPFDLESALATSGWREHAASFVMPSEVFVLADRQMRDALAWADGLEDRLGQDAVLLALPTILAYARAIAVAALGAGRAAKHGHSFLTQTPELLYLLHGDGSPPGRGELVMPSRPASLAFLRRLARMRSWSGLAGLPRAALFADSVAISHNPLLIGDVARSGAAVGFVHAEALLAGARETTKPAPGEGATAAADLAGVCVDAVAIDEPWRGRAMAMTQATARLQIGQALRDMSGLRQARLPEAVRSGSGGMYAPRAVGLEVLRRGGSVHRYDHGTPRGFVADTASTVLLETGVSSHFALATEAAAANCIEQSLPPLLARRPEADLVGLDGDGCFAPRPRRRASATDRPRIVYAPTMLLGFRQLMPPLPPDPVYLDWQMRVAEALGSLPADFICQPHPEGLLKGRPHPLEQVARTIRGDFERQLDEADVFVFDFSATTALWQACCTEARIVYLDIGSGRFSPKIRALMAERAAVVGVAHDERGRPVLDREALAEAAMDRSRQPDPTGFRRMLAGTG